MTGQPNRAQRRAALTAARAQGCTCQPHITTSTTHAGGIPTLQLAHDDWCPLLRATAERTNRRPSQAVIYRPEAFE